jgi:diguanylate cyclase (GGDEF)-like protein
MLVHRLLARSNFMRLFFCVFFLLFSLPSFAVNTLLTDKTPDFLELGPYVDLLEDVELEYGADDIYSHIFNDKFKPIFQSSANYGFSKSAWWVRFTVRNSDTKAHRRAFKLDYPLLDKVDVWVLRGNSQVAAWQTGNRRSFNSRPIWHRDFLFPLNLQIGEEQTVYIRVQTEGPVNIGLTLHSADTLVPKIEAEYMTMGAYFGSLLVLVLCLLVFYLIDRQIAFLYYLAYVLCYGSYLLAFNGLAFQYFWPDLPEFGQIIRPILLTLSTIFLLQFSRKLLGIQKASPKLYQAVTGLQGVLALILLLAPFIGYGAFVMPLAYLEIAAIILVVAMGIVAHKRGVTAARYYLIAWSVFLTGLLVYLLKVLGYLPHNFITHYGFQIGSFVEFILLSAALGIRVRELRFQSHIDGLTELPNRRSFDQELAEEFSISSRPEAQLSLMVIDVDHFKKFNDQHGHAAGDKVLKELGNILKQRVRRPGAGYRYGGEEFAVLLPRTGPEDALAAAERLRACVAEELYYIDVTVSIGVVSLAKGKFSNVAQFFIAGDKALYAAKSAGRNQVVLYTDTLTEPVQDSAMPEVS